jgi:CheY-like chemotaxis protein
MAATQTLTLVVEDDPSTREFIVRALSKRGMGSIQAASVGEALMKLDEEPLPTAIILDLRLPDANGTLLLRRIRRDQLPIRTAVVTGADPEQFHEMLRFPPDKVFRKPIDVAELLAWLQQDE